MKRKIENETFFRELTLDRKGMNTEARIVPAALSSETEVPRWFGREVLAHESGAVDLSRAVDGLPLLFSHDHNQPIGLAENVRLDGDKLRADLRFSNNAKASEVWGDVRDGFLKNISIGYRVRKWEENDKDDVVRVTDWELLEASVVTVPADAAVGINRGQDFNGDQEMTDKDKTADGADKGQPTNVVDYKAARDSAKADGMIEGARAEAKRRDEIDNLFKGVRYQGEEYQGLRKALIDNGDSIERARDELLKLVGSTSEPLASGDYKQDRGIITGGATDGDKFIEAMGRALEVRTNIEKDKERIREIRSTEFASMNMGDMAREYCRRNKIPTGGLSRDQIVGAAMRGNGITHSASDFSNVLENIATKSLLSGWSEAPETWQTWTRQGSLPDFKQASRTGVSAFSDLDIVYENGEYKYGTFSDLKENIQLVTYGKLFGISRQAIANDDLDALSATPYRMGRAASRKVGDQVYGTLYSNSGVGPTLNQDSTALFDAAGHSNYLASGSGGAPTVTTLNVAEVAMGTQTDPSGAAYLNIEPRYLIVPKALANTCRVLVAAQYDPAGTAGTLTPNPFSGRLDVVVEPRLDANLSTGWYLAGDQNMWDTIEVAFYEGRQEPYLEQKDGWNTDGVEFKVRIDCAVAALDYRALYKNYGA